MIRMAGERGLNNQLVKDFIKCLSNIPLVKYLLDINDKLPTSRYDIVTLNNKAFNAMRACEAC